MTRNVNLKAALFSLGKTQDWLAKDSEVSPSYLSAHINGKFNLSDEQKVAIVNSLNRVAPRAGFTIAELFRQGGQGE